MIDIVVAKEAGACYGVQRALEMVQKAAEAPDANVRTLGPLIHNPAVVRSLEAAGVAVVEQPEEATGMTLLLRTHGVTPDEERRARTACATVLDATCPFVIRCHRAAERLAQEGYQVLIVGEKGHPEVEGTLGHAPEASVIGSIADLSQLKLSSKVGVVVQTTMTRAVLEEVVSWLVGRVEELRVINTICEATSQRQRAAVELASQASCMIVIGGRNSANTTHLAELCRAHCANTHHIESPAELDPSWIPSSGVIGVTAGASTPQSQIDESCQALRRLCDAAEGGRQ